MLSRELAEDKPLPREEVNKQINNILKEREYMSKRYEEIKNLIHDYASTFNRIDNDPDHDYFNDHFYISIQYH